MIILAKTRQGMEFTYQTKSAHKVSKASATKILNIVNQFRFDLSSSEIWHMYEIDKYSLAYNYATKQDFIIRNGIVKARHY